MTRRLEILVVGVMVPLLVLALTPLWSSLFRDEKKLEYNIRARSFERARISSQDWPEISILYQNERFPRGTFISVVITNTGSLPIRPQDFEGPLLVRADKPVLLAYRKEFSSPPDVPIVAQVMDSALEVRPLLLNPGDLVVLELFGRDEFKVTGVTARIAGVGAIGQMEERLSSGIYLVRITQQGLGRTTHTALLRFPLYQALMSSFLGLSLSAAAAFLAFRSPSRMVRPIIGVFALGIYSGTIWLLLIAYEALTQIGAQRWASLALLLALHAVAVFAGYYWGRRILVMAIHEK